MGDCPGWEIIDCSRCGERIGHRERAWFLHADGGLSTGAPVNVDPAARASIRSAWHERCFAPEDPR